MESSMMFGLAEIIQPGREGERAMFGRKATVKQERSPLPQVSLCECGRETALCFQCRREYCPACDNHVVEVSQKLYRMSCQPVGGQELFEQQLQEILDHVELGRARGMYSNFSETWSLMSGNLIRRMGRHLSQPEQKKLWNGLIDVFPLTKAKRWM